MAAMGTPGRPPRPSPGSANADERRGGGWMFVGLGLAVSLIAGLAWLALYWFGGFGTPAPSVQRVAWIVLAVGVVAAAIPSAHGIRRLNAQGWSHALRVGLLIAASPALLVVTWGLIRSTP